MAQLNMVGGVDGVGTHKDGTRHTVSHGEPNDNNNKTAK